MAFDFKFPDVGEGIHEGVIVAWLVKAGDTVRMDQPFVKVETDKAVVDLPAPKGGTVLALHFAKAPPSTWETSSPPSVRRAKRQPRPPRRFKLPSRSTLNLRWPSDSTAAWLRHPRH
jgi:hypothetical protein